MIINLNFKAKPSTYSQALLKGNQPTMRGLKMTFVILLCVIEAACSKLGKFLLKPKLR